MKVFKIKPPFFKATTYRYVSLVDNVLTVMNVRPATDPGEPTTGKEILIEDTRYIIVDKACLDISSISGYNNHTVLAMHGSTNGKYIVDLFPQTMNGRMTIQEYTNSTSQVIAHVHIPFAGSNDDVVLTIPESDTGVTFLSGDLLLQEQTFASFEESVDAIMPKLEFVNITKSDDTLSAQVILKDGSGSTVPYDATIFFETTSGVLLNQRANLVDGIGDVRVSLAGVPQGSNGKLKAGFRYYPGKVELSFYV